MLYRISAKNCVRHGFSASKDPDYINYINCINYIQNALFKTTHLQDPRTFCIKSGLWLALTKHKSSIERFNHPAML